MTTLIRRGFALLNRAMEPAAAESVRYIRGAAVISDELPATLSAPQIEQIQEGGTIIGRQFSWQLKRSGLMLDGIPIKPERYDLIDWVYGGTAFRFEVLPAGSAESGAVDMRSDWVPVNVKLIERQ